MGSGGFPARQGLIQSPNTLATVAHAIMRDRFGDEWYWWDPLTVMLELQAEFKTDPCPEFMDRVSAMQVLMTGDSFFRRIDSFMGVCNAFSSGDPFFGSFDPVTAEEAAWGVAEAGMNRDMLEFSPTIRKYCQTVLRENGYGDGDDLPAFRAVFDGPIGLPDVRAGMVSAENGAALREYLEGQAMDLAAQLDSLPDLRGFDAEVVRNGLVSAFRLGKEGGNNGLEGENS